MLVSLNVVKSIKKESRKMKLIKEYLEGDTDYNLSSNKLTFTNNKFSYVVFIDIYIEQ